MRNRAQVLFTIKLYLSSSIIETLYVAEPLITLTDAWKMVRKNGNKKMGQMVFNNNLDKEYLLLRTFVILYCGH